MFTFSGVYYHRLMTRKTRQIVKSFSRGESPWKLTPNSLDWCSSHWTFYFINPYPLFIAVLSSKLTDPKVPRPPVKDNFVKDSSVQFSRSLVSTSLQPHELQHARPPCPSPTPGVHSNSRPRSWWCHPAISSSVLPSSPAPNPSQQKSLFQWVNSSHEVAKVLEFQL